MKVLCDIETDSLDPTVVHCIVCYEFATHSVRTFVQDECYNEFLKYAEQVTHWVGHNFIGFDAWALNKLLGLEISYKNIDDTYVMSQLSNPERWFGHSLEGWGEFLKYPKIDFKNFEEYSEEMLEYCIQDVRLNVKVYELVQKELHGFSPESIRIEHEVRQYISEMERNGIAFNGAKANALYAEVKEKVEVLEAEIKQHFKYFTKLYKTYIPKYKKDGTLSSVGTKTLSPADLDRVPRTKPSNFDNNPEKYGIDIYKQEEFNLNSPSQIVTLLNDIGWEPYERTDGWQKTEEAWKKKEISSEEYQKKSRMQWKVNEANLETIPDTAPAEYKLFAKWKMLYSRMSWLGTQCAPNVRNGRIYGRCNSLGAVTNRMTHSNPNLGNISSLQHAEDKETGEEYVLMGEEGRYGYECRELFQCTQDGNHVLLGSDADALELRMLAHYMNDNEFTKTILEGTKADGTDIHSVNQRKAGLPTRSNAKTFIYAFLYGAGDEKVGRIIGGRREEGKELKERFLAATPKLDQLIKEVQKAARKNKRIKSLDGRYINIRKPFAALNSLLQSAGAITCKWWLCFIMRAVRKEGLDVKLVAAVHDEYQFDVAKKDAERLGEICELAMEHTGRVLKTKLPLKADFDIGENWAATH